MSSTPLSYFESMYGASLDPWGFESSSYERRKYALTLASLPQRRYANAFEPGCSIGVLSEMLAARCEQLLSSDVISAALEQAARRLEPYPHVRVEERRIPDDWPPEEFDLVVLSEIGYYFDETTLREVMDRVIDSTTIGAHVVAVHWRGDTDYPLSGDQTHHLIDETSELICVHRYVEDAFVLGVWERESR
jgi:hypothetical protein